MQNSTIRVYGQVEFRYNKLNGLIEFQCITENCFTMNIADNASLTIADNRLIIYFYAEWPDRYPLHKLKYSPCFFQYLSKNIVQLDDEVSYVNCSILFIRNTCNIFEASVVDFFESFKVMDTKGSINMGYH